MAEFRKRAARVAKHAGRHLGCEWFDMAELVRLPGPVPRGQFGVELCTNAAAGSASPPCAPDWRVVDGMRAAKQAVADYLRSQAGVVRRANWGAASGRVWDHQGEVVAKITYDLRCLTDLRTLSRARLSSVSPGI